MKEKILQTTVVGSYPRLKYAEEAKEKFKKGEINEGELRKIYGQATQEVVEDQIKAGVDIIADGEQGRDDMEVFFAERIEGFQEGGMVRVWGNNYFKKPLVNAKVNFKKPMTLDDFILSQKTAGQRAQVKGMFTGPYTLTDWTFYDDPYEKKEELVIDLAKVMHREAKALNDAGCRYIQLDEPALSTHNNKDELEIAKEAVEIVTKGLEGKTAIHICYGDMSILFPEIIDFNIGIYDFELVNNNFKTLELLKKYDFQKSVAFGCIDVHTEKVETKEEVKKYIKKGLDFLAPEKIYPDPDCGLRLLPRKIAFEKLKVMCEAVKEIKEKL